MGRLTAGPVPLFAALFSLLPCLACAGGGGSGPLAPIQLVDWASSLTTPDQPVTELFNSDIPLEFVLAADFDQLGKDRSQVSEERPGQILLRGFDGEPVEIPLQVKTRGNFRLRRSTCSDPPLHLDFSETPPQGTVLDGVGKLKLVTHCRDSDRYEQNLVEEFLAYRLFNQLSDIGLRVQLAEITYLDTSRRNDSATRLGFLLENEDAMATRLSGRIVETSSGNPGDFVQEQLVLVYLFQFMIGNVDWGVGTGHNVKILLRDGRYYPFPYDFDWSGLVDAPYAGPNPMTERLHDSVRERVYWGACLEGTDWESLFEFFNSKRGPMTDLIENQWGLSERNVRSAREYIDQFFEVINDPWMADRAIFRACRKW